MESISASTARPSSFVKPAKTSMSMGSIDSSVRGISLLKKVRCNRLQRRLRPRVSPDSARDFFPAPPVSGWGSRKVGEEFDMRPVDRNPDTYTTSPSLENPGSRPRQHHNALCDSACRP